MHYLCWISNSTLCGSCKIKSKGFWFNHNFISFAPCWSLITFRLHLFSFSRRLAPSAFPPPGSLQREPESVREAGGVSPERPFTPVHRGVRDHTSLRLPQVSLPQAVPGLRPPTPQQGRRAEGRHRRLLQSADVGQTLLWPLQSQLEAQTVFQTPQLYGVL